MTKAHVLARAVDVIPDIVYYWRERARGGCRSPRTAAHRQPAGPDDRAWTTSTSSSRAHSTAALLRAHQRKALKNDLWLYVQDLHKVTEAYRAEFTTLVNGYLDHVGGRVLRSLPATHKLAYYLVRIQALPQLAELAAWMMDQPVRQVPMVRRRGLLWPTCPSAPNLPCPCPAGCSGRTGATWTPTCRWTTSSWADGRLVVDRPGQRALGRRSPAPEYHQARCPAASRPAPAGGPGRTLVPQPRGHGPVRAGPLQLRLVRFPVHGLRRNACAVRGMAALHARPRPRRVAPGPRAYPGARPRRAPPPREVAPGLRFGARWAWPRPEPRQLAPGRHSPPPTTGTTAPLAP